VNKHQLAVWVTKQEGLKQSLSIAQVKEVIRIIETKYAIMPAVKLKAALAEAKVIRKKARKK